MADIYSDKEHGSYNPMQYLGNNQDDYPNNIFLNLLTKQTSQVQILYSNRKRLQRFRLKCVIMFYEFYAFR
ncbi:MAG: hypothetical protein LC116_08325 [Bacteroidetes bacterium]|nr:hypothetical protein [Bacteroidota bacterium]